MSYKSKISKYTSDNKSAAKREDREGKNIARKFKSKTKVKKL